jgi:branched-chain amino acid transport system substrate-binding protein
MQGNNTQARCPGKRRLMALLLALMGVGALGAVPVRAAGPLKIGFMATFSGPGGVLGKELYDGFMLGVEHAGGHLGGLATEVLQVDDQLKPDVAKQAVERMIQKDKVHFITGVVFSNVMMAIYKPVIEANTFLVSANAGPSPIAGELCSAFFFSSSWQNDQMHSAVGQYVQDRGYKQVFLLAPNYQAGLDAIAGFKRHYTGSVAGELYPKLGQIDFTAEIAQIRAATPDAMFTFMPGGMGISLVKQLAESGLMREVPFFSAFTVDHVTIPAIGEAVVGALTPTIWGPDLDNAANARFVGDFKKKYGRMPSYYAVQGYDAAQLIGSAVQAVGGDLSQQDKLRQALAQAKFQSPRGKFAFNHNHFPIQDFYIAEAVQQADGTLGIAIRQKVFTDAMDAYHHACKM